MTLHTGVPASRRPCGYCLIADGKKLSDHKQFWEADALQQHFIKNNFKTKLITREQAYVMGLARDIPTQGQENAVHPSHI